ncbi:MAG: hypothetical protein LBF85_09270 [Tannerella sp.]|jgi:hypothetical protein|nr:hypothetical protein [Tannerella sp.]
MKKAVLLYLMTGMFAVLLLTGCRGKSTVDDSIALIEQAIEKLEKKETDLTEEDWTAFSEEIREPLDVLKEALEENRVGAIKKIRIVVLAGKLITVAGKSGFSAVADETIKKLRELEKE